MPDREPVATAPLGVNITVHATDGKRERAFPNLKRYFSLGEPRFIGLPNGWHARTWEAQAEHFVEPSGADRSA